MKKLKMARFLLILLSLTTYTLATAQYDFVVTLEGDTIKGKVKYLNFGTSKSVQVTTDSKKSTYPMLQTKAFRLKNEIYHPVRVVEGYTYMKVLKEGYLSLYAYQVANQTAWEGRLLLKKDGDFIDVPNLSFRKLMSRFLSECPEVVAKIESGDLSKKDIDKIVDEYNNWIAEKSHMIKQETEASKAKASAWIELENEIRKGADFESRNDALEMIEEIKLKIKNGDTVPKFLTEGLKSALSQQEGLKELLERALSELK